MVEKTVSKITSDRLLKSSLVQLNSTGASQDFLGKGDEASVHRALVEIQGRHVPQGLAYKEYRVGRDAEQAIIAWRELKSAQAPVPPTFRIVGESGNYTGILMTDLTKGWHDILLSSNATKTHVLQNVYKISPQTVRDLAEVDVEKVMLAQKLKETFVQIAQRMAKAKIEIAHADVVSLIFTENGNVLPMISDMKNVVCNSSKSFEQLLTINRNHLSDSLLWLSEGKRIARKIVEEEK
jgi:hypothetical protein